MQYTPAITTRDFARLLNVSPRTIQRNLAAGLLPPPIPLATREYRWRPEVIEQFMLHGLAAQQNEGTEHV